MESIIRALKLEYNFAATGNLNTAISKYLQQDITETSSRPVYYNVKKVKLWDKVWTAVYLSLFFEVNPGYNKIGYHSGDVEKLILLFDEKIAGQEWIPTWIYFSAHGNGQGIWKRWQDCKFTSDGFLKVFISPFSNAHYPSPGTYLRVCGFANDVCVDGQNPFRPEANDFCNAMTQSWTNSFYQVAKGINTPAHPDPPPSSGASSVQRFFLFIPSVKKSIQNGQKGEFVE